MAGPPTLSRQAARVVMLDQTGAVLLLSGRDPAVAGAPGFWFVPGGGAHPGEALEATARREVYEETGAVLGDLGPVVWRRHASFAFDGIWYEQSESFFVVRTEAFVPRPTALTELEQRFTTGARWWALAQLASTEEVVYPGRLAALVTEWVASEAPERPLTID